MTTSEKKVTKFVLKPGGTKAIYADRDRSLLERLDHEENRASHVDPLHKPDTLSWLRFWDWAALSKQYEYAEKYGPGYWAIYWKGQFSHWSPDFCDDVGQPFKTKHEAELYEVARLERDYLNVRRAGPLYIECLLNEKGNSHVPIRDAGTSAAA